VAWIIDGSNVLGALGWSREAAESKARLTTLCARFARGEKTRVVLCFDGAAPAGFARKLGIVSVRFCHPRAADDVIVGETRDSPEPWTVVTSDAGVASRVRRRTVKVVSSREFAGRLKAIEETPDEDVKGGAEDDWSEYFSDPKNRLF
jgi:predicted RNA-binding protein with PIN domain